ncbi:fatty acid desaturase [Bacteroidota bacterium]|nr:fatty acid desaturase [Bacteroidota bacterium]
MIQTKVTFQNQLNKDFHDTLKSRVKEYFEKNNLSIHADSKMITKTIVLLSGLLVTYLSILNPLTSLWIDWLLCIVLGFFIAGIGFSIAHDAIHQSYSSNKTINNLLSLTMNLIGGNAYVWSITHNIVHHTYTNINDHDEDLELAPFIRLSKHQEYRKIHRWQHYFAFIAYGFATFFWVHIKDFKKISQKNIGPYKNKKHPAREIILLITSKLLYYTYIIVIPLMVLPITWWQFLIGYLTMHLTSGIILGVVFQLAHTVENTEHPLANEQHKMPDSWAVHQMRTTNNFGMNNKILNWYIGGLNFQIEHHLFPHICSTHYKKISPIIQQTAQEFDVPYYHHNTFREAVASHYRYLKLLSNP